MQHPSHSVRSGRAGTGALSEGVLRFQLLHFHETLWKEHQIQVSYSWVKQALQRAGLVRRRSKRGSHRRRRARRPLPGMLPHIDGGKHRWFQDDRYYDLMVILDDLDGDGGLREVIETRGVFCVLYRDRGSHGLGIRPRFHTLRR
jgi:hypothetical protein